MDLNDLIDTITNDFCNTFPEHKDNIEIVLLIKWTIAKTNLYILQNNRHNKNEVKQLKQLSYEIHNNKN